MPHAAPLHDLQEYAEGGDLYRLLHKNGGRCAECSEPCVPCKLIMGRDVCSDIRGGDGRSGWTRAHPMGPLLCHFCMLLMHMQADRVADMCHVAKLETHSRPCHVQAERAAGSGDGAAPLLAVAALPAHARHHGEERCWQPMQQRWQQRWQKQQRQQHSQAQHSAGDKDVGQEGWGRAWGRSMPT